MSMRLESVGLKIEVHKRMATLPHGATTSSSNNVECASSMCVAGIKARAKSESCISLEVGLKQCPIGEIEKIQLWVRHRSSDSPSR